MRSLLAPLALGLAVSLAVVFGIQWSLVQGAIDLGMHEFIAGELAQDADELASGLVTLGGGPVSIAFKHYDPAYLSPGSGRYYEVMVGSDTALLSPSLEGHSLSVAPVRAGERVVRTLEGVRGEALLVSAAGYPFEGRAVTIAVAASLGAVHRQVRRMLDRYTVLTLAMFAALVAIQVVIVRVALLPLRRVRDDVARLERGEITQLREAVPVEVLPLVREVNRLLALLTERLRRSRDALGNLAHALKAPLTVLGQAVEDDRVRSDAQLHERLTAQLDRLRERIDSELRRARVAGGRAPGPEIDLASELQSLAATVEKIHRERHLQVECRVSPDARFRGDREDLLELCGNLLDNACKWGRSRVVLRASGAPGLEITVADDGPGCTEADIERLARRGVRLDEDVAGHGLGLSIARDIAAAYGASMTFGRSQALGGFEATVAFRQD